MQVWTRYPNLSPVGLMGMATFTDDQAQVRREFESTLHSTRSRTHAF